MSEDIGSYTPNKTSMVKGDIDITAFSAGTEYGYHFSFNIDEAKKQEQNESFRFGELPESLRTLMYFSLSGTQIEDLYRMHLERKIDGLEQMDRVQNPKCVPFRKE